MKSSADISSPFCPDLSPCSMSKSKFISQKQLRYLYKSKIDEIIIYQN